MFIILASFTGTFPLQNKSYVYTEIFRDYTACLNFLSGKCNTRTIAMYNLKIIRDYIKSRQVRWCVIYSVELIE
jgi:hypothetical protein